MIYCYNFLSRTQIQNAKAQLGDSFIMDRKFREQSILQKLQRIHRLSEKAINPSYAYRNLDHIHALTDFILKELEVDSESSREQKIDKKLDKKNVIAL